MNQHVIEIMKNPRVLFVSDLDGTLLNDNARLTQKTIGILNTIMRRGANFTIATGRTPLSTSTILSELSLKLPQVLMNGALIQSPSGDKLFHYERITRNEQEFLSYMEAKLELHGLVFYVKNHSLLCSFGCEVSALWDSFFERNSISEQNIQSLTDTESTLSLPVIYAIYIDDKPERLAEFCKQLNFHGGYTLDYYNDSYDKGTWCLEIYSSSASKKTAVRRLRDLTKANYVIGFGDSQNDLALFSECDECYAVSNALYEVRQAATAIIGSNKEDAVACFIANRQIIGTQGK